jgi:hypothetical protein
MDKKGKMYVEKRSHKRHNKEFLILYKLMPKKISVETIRKQGKSEDVSLGGIKIQGDAVGEIGDIIRCEIFGRDKNDLIIVLAQIMWVKIKGTASEFGVKFIGLREEEAESLEDMLEI